MIFREYSDEQIFNLGVNGCSLKSEHEFHSSLNVSVDHGDDESSDDFLTLHYSFNYSFIPYL